MNALSYIGGYTDRRPSYITAHFLFYLYLHIYLGKPQKKVLFLVAGPLRGGGG